MNNQNNVIVEFDNQAREDLLKGVNILADAVKTTMGPRGRNVVIEVPGCHPIVTKDGVTVAKSINLKDQFLNLGVQMIKEAASRTADTAGDGTTTATVLSQAIFSEGLKMLAAGFDAADIKAGIEIGTSMVVENLKQMSVPITKAEEVEQVATISANGESSVGSLISDAIRSVGVDGVVTVEEAKGFNSTLSVVEGMQIDRGYLSPYFITDQDKMIVEMENPAILLYNKRIDNLREIMDILEKSASQKRSLLIVADDVEGEAMQGLVVNKTRGALKVCAIKAPSFGESRIGMLDDLATVLGTEVFSAARAENISELNLEDLGSCKKVIVGRNRSVFVGGSGDPDEISSRADFIRNKIIDPSTERDETEFLKLRLSRLSGGVAQLHVGGATEAELRERRDRVDDALNATQAAIEEGIVPGGGTALVRASSQIDTSHALPGVEAGIKVVKKSCLYPAGQIIKNAGGASDLVLEKLKSISEPTHGYDALRDRFGDMFEMGIIDPLKVVRSSIENASSSASMMLTVGCAIVDDIEEAL